MSIPDKTTATKRAAIKLKSGIRTFVFGLPAAIALHPGSLWACAACFGQSNSPMAKGMNWGIFSLLAVVAGVLGSIAGFALFLAKRAAASSASVSTVPEPSVPIYQNPLTDSR
jgi:hypothetical protein